MQTDELANELERLLAEITPIPVSEQWMYSAIRHCQRNMDYGDLGSETGDDVPDRHCGVAIAKLVNHLPAILQRGGEKP